MKFLLVFFSLLSLVACEFSWFNSDPVLASVGEVKLKESYLKSKVQSWDSLSKREKIVWIENWIDEESIYQAALNQGFNREKSVRERIRSAERKIVVDAFTAKEVDSISVSPKEIRSFYDSNPEHFLYDKWIWSGFIISYNEWKWASSYYKSKQSSVFSAEPSSDFRLKTKTAFNEVLETPDSCLAVDLRELELGKLSQPKACGGLLKSIVITARQDSGTVIPFDSVSALAKDLSYMHKRQEALKSFKLNLKKKLPIYSNSELFADSLTKKRNK
jgi:hypothetical protein